jgi:hypothetical protein
MPDSKNPTPGEITIMAAGAVTLIASFLDFYKAPGGFGGSVSAWGKGLFPVTTILVVSVVLMAVLVALTKFANMNLPSQVLGFTWDQIYLILGFFAALYAVAWLIRNKGGLDFGIGFWFILIGALASLVGAILLQRERTGVGRPGAPPTA